MADEREWQQEASGRARGVTDKFTLSYYMPNDPDPHGPPFKYRTHYLAEALADGWRNHREGGRAVSIMLGQRAVFDEEELPRAFTRMDELERAVPDREPVEIADQIIQETGKATPL